MLILFCHAARQWFYAAGASVFERRDAARNVDRPPAQLLHGITFGLFWSVGTCVRAEDRARGRDELPGVMGVFGGANAGGSLGSVLGGVAFRKHGGDGLFAGIGVMNSRSGAWRTSRS